jgi:ABC-type lipoprotein release transport system permease subunit
MQTVAFLNVWSIAVYAVVAAASYIAATRLITESSYELAMLTAIGAKKRLTFTLILAYTITIALLSSILGIALGIAGTQTASTMLRWIMPSVDVTPFPEAEQPSRCSANACFISYWLRIPSREIRANEMYGATAMRLLGFKYLKRQRVLTLALIITVSSMLFSLTALSLLGFYRGFTVEYKRVHMFR